MLTMSRVFRTIPVLVVLLLLAAPSAATTMVRRGLETLTAENPLIVQATVLDLHSYWNSDRTFILTDVRARPSLWMKGQPPSELTFTVMGGTVGDVTMLVVGGPDVAPGSEYVLFLGRNDLPGSPGRLTVRDLAQGAFEIRNGRAFSQAIGEVLLPDAQGESDVPGGAKGLLLEDLARRVRELR